MNKNKKKLFSQIIIVTALITILISGWTLLNSGSVTAERVGKCTQSCPDGPPVSCEGSVTRSIDEDTNNPGCECDGEAFRCSDRKKDNKNKKKDKKKDSNSNVNSNVNVANTPAVNNNNQ